MRNVSAVFAATVIIAGVAGADPVDDWLIARRAEFNWWQKTDPVKQSRLDRLKRQTAELLSLRPEPGGLDDAPVIFRVGTGVKRLWDVPLAPRLTIIPAGEFTMGSPDSESDRTTVEGPRHRVRIAYPLAVGTFPVTRDEYAAFVADTRRSDPDGCRLTHVPGSQDETAGYNWHNPGFAQTGSDPVVCVSWQDARDYAAWLTTRTGERYRLLSEAEWEYASRAGSATARPWGDPISHDNANYRADGGPGRADVFEFTAPVGSFPRNAFGLYDVLGNVWQRLDDCWNADYINAPADGSVWLRGDCTKRTGHAGAFDAAPNLLRSAFRGSVPGTMHYSDGGFRIAREL